MPGTLCICGHSPEAPPRDERSIAAGAARLGSAAGSEEEAASARSGWSALRCISVGGRVSPASRAGELYTERIRAVDLSCLWSLDGRAGRRALLFTVSNKVKVTVPIYFYCTVL